MTISEIVARPAETVQELYRKAGCPVLDGDWGVVEHFQKAVSTLASGELPCLNDIPIERIRHQSLVRYYGMVQDMLNPEFYVGAFQRPNGQWTTTKYCDPEIPEDCTDSDPIVWERRPFVLVPIPGLSRWSFQKPGADHASSRAAPPTFLDSSHPAPTSPTSAHIPSAHANAADTAASSPAPAQDTSSSQRSLEQGQQGPQQQQARPKRERSSSDADASCAQLQAHASEQSPSTLAAATAAGPAGGHASIEALRHDDGDSPRDTDQAGDQGDGALASGYALGGPGDGDEGAARPRTRRREDVSHSGITGPVAMAAATSTPDRCDSGMVAAGCCGGSAHAPGACPEQESTSSAEHVPNSCMAYLYGNAPTPLLHEIVEVIGILSHVPEFAQLEYGSPDDPHLAHELASLVLGGGGGAPAPAANNTSNSTQQQQGEPKQAGEGGAAAGMGPAPNLGGFGADRLAFEALRAAHPPTSKVVRLHTVLVRRTPPLMPTPSAAEAPSSSSLPCPAPAIESATAVTTTAAATIAPTITPTSPASSVLSPSVAPAPVPPLRDRALGLLRFALGGDALAAEYVLMTLLARVASRVDPAALGLAPLNIIGCPKGTSTSAMSTTQCSSSPACAHPSATGAPSTSFSGNSNPPLAAERLGRGPSGFAAGLQAAISSLVPLSVTLPLSLEACGGVSWSPVRDVVRERTAPSPLQLAPGTVLVLDETGVAPGQFSSQGFASFKALKTLVEQQVLMYDFESSQHPIPVDLPIILLSEGRSLLGSSAPLKIPLNATQPLPTVDAVLAAAADLGAVRSYLAAARAQEGYELGEGMPSVLEQFFVDARRSVAEGDNAVGGSVGGRGGDGAMSAEEFHLKLTLARLLVLSHGEKQLTRERWQQLLRMEHMREERLRVVR